MSHEASHEGVGGATVRVVLDTSFFTNPESLAPWGEDRLAGITAFVETAEALRGRVRFLMPPSIYDELLTFVAEEELPAAFPLVVELRAPNRYQAVVPGFLLYELIDEIRGRIDRGLRVAEAAVREAHPQTVDQTISRLRERYRAALRAGLLDSREDVDLILLAVELDAALVSSDQGVVKWAEKLGTRLITPGQLHRLMTELAE